MSFLRRLFGADEPEQRAPTEPADASNPPDGEDLPFDVERLDRGEWQYEISFDDVVAHIEEDRVERFVELLDAENGVDQAVHEDREVVLVKAKRMAGPAMQAAASRAWTIAGEQVGVKTLEEWEREQES